MNNSVIGLDIAKNIFHLYTFVPLCQDTCRL